MLLSVNGAFAATEFELGLTVAKLKCIKCSELNINKLASYPDLAVSLGMDAAFFPLCYNYVCFPILYTN